MVRLMVDLRYTIPPVVNRLLFWFSGSGSWKLIVSFIYVQQFSVLELGFLILAMMFLLLFLHTSAEIPLNLSSIDLRAGRFSIALTTSLLASLFLPPFLFWAVFLLIVFSSPWQHMFFQLLIHFFQLFSDALKSIPPYIIAIVAQTEGTPTADSTPPEGEANLELGLGLIQDGHQYDQQNSENDD